MTSRRAPFCSPVRSAHALTGPRRQLCYKLRLGVQPLNVLTSPRRLSRPKPWIGLQPLHARTRLPQMGGIEMVQLLFETHSHPNVITMSGHNLSDLIPEEVKKLCSVIEKIGRGWGVSGL